MFLYIIIFINLVLIFALSVICCIIFNKYNSNSISLELLEKIFNEFKILGKINYDKKIDIILNKNKLIKINKIENDLNKIIEKIIK